MSLRERVQLAVIERTLVVGACFDKIKRAEREARKENRPVPRFEMDKLQGELRDAKANVASAEAAAAGVSKYPPVR